MVCFDRDIEQTWLAPASSDGPMLGALSHLVAKENLAGKGWRFLPASRAPVEKPGSRPVAAVQRAVLDGLGQMRNGQVLGSFEIRDGAGYFEDAVMSAGGQALLLHGALQ
jgi:hypothetical protein